MERVIAAWRKAPPETADEIERRETSAQKKAVLRLLKTFRSLEWPLFNPFSHCGVIPLERYTRDFFAAMSDSDAPHGIAAAVFGAFLDEVAQVNLRSRAKVASVLAAWDGTLPNVETEMSLAEARPDVLLWGGDFLIAIEIKRRFGIETIVGREYQSKRLQRSILAFAKEKSISPTCVLAVFLTPEGKTSKDPALIPVNAERLFNRIDGRIRNDRWIPTKTKLMIRSYTHMLMGGVS